MLTPTGFSPLRGHASQISLEELLSRAKSLYTLPQVAVDVLRLTNNPAVEPRTIKECISRDPALTAKILRVVNSSLYGLPGEVSDLNQAISLLGIKPLKVLVLGFSLPSNLVGSLAREELKWYWSTTLTRAVAAREISESLFHTAGDEAFVAGLLQSLGVLVFAKQIGPSYTMLLRQAIESGSNVREIETEALGFDHIKLSAALLKEWNIPRQLVDAIASQHDPRTLAKEHRLNNPLARVLHLANLTSDLVGQRRLSVLPDLIEAGAAYCNLDKTGLHDLIVALQPKVNQLADVLALDVDGGVDYLEILIAAHEQMSELAEGAFAPLKSGKMPKYQTTESLLQDAVQLRAAMDGFLRGPFGESSDTKSKSQKSTASQQKQSKASTVKESSVAQAPDPQFVQWITLIAGACRSKRQPLSVIMLEISDDTPEIDDNEHVIAQLLDSTCREELPPNTLMENNANWRRTVVVPACDRHETVRLAQSLIRSVERSVEELVASGQTVQGVISVGVASVTLPSKSFRPADLLHAADRCLAAARASEVSVVKSIEIY